jgi:cobalt/nickel transport system permease protein
LAVARFSQSCYFEASAIMHIPDNFLSTPVWVALDAICIPAVGIMVRRAGREMEDTRVPLMGVMGAFVFAAQMINFPVGLGTSGHLVGGALLACTLGAAPAALVMTAIIAIQAFVFQDGGVLALGANVFNMALAGVLAGYLPIQLVSQTSRPVNPDRPGGLSHKAIFAGAFLSVLVSASLALSELLISGITMPRPVLLLSMGLFVISALIEGAITVSVVGAIGKLNPGFVQKADASNGRILVVLSAVAVILGVTGFVLASSAPDGIQRLALQLGLTTKSGFHGPFADYTVNYFASPWLRRASAGLAGLLVIYGICAAVSKFIARQRSA